MNARRKLSEAGFARLMELEGYTETARHLPGDRLGVITGGFGDTRVTLGETHTRAEWTARLRNRASIYENYVNAGVVVPLVEEMFDALFFFVYNVGPGNPKANPPIDGFLTSTLRRKLNLRDYAGAANEFQRWNKVAGQVCNGLTNRRAAEEALFRRGMARLLAGSQAA